MKNKQPLHSIAVLFARTIFVLFVCSEYAWGYQVSRVSDSGPEIRWATPSADFYINTAGGPLGTLSAIQAAMKTWTDVSTSKFSFIYRGQTTHTNCGINDGTNITCFASLGAGDANTLARNTYWFSAQTGFLSDSDIEFNTDYAWATDRSMNALDLQTLTLHELGHSLSLEDLKNTGDTAKVMYGFCDLGEIKRSLTQDDKDGITYLYPGGGTTTTTTIITVTCPAEYVLGQDHPDLQQLRALRDDVLSRSVVGRRIIQMYYNNSDSINAAIQRSPALRMAARSFFEAAAMLLANKQ